MAKNGIKLNTEKITKILEKVDRNPSWLARQAGVSRALVHYDLKSGCPNRAYVYANVLGIFEPEQLLIIS